MLRCNSQDEWKVTHVLALHTATVQYALVRYGTILPSTPYFVLMYSVQDLGLFTTP